MPSRSKTNETTDTPTPGQLRLPDLNDPLIIERYSKLFIPEGYEHMRRGHDAWNKRALTAGVGASATLGLLFARRIRLKLSTSTVRFVSLTR